MRRDLGPNQHSGPPNFAACAALPGFNLSSTGAIDVATSGPGAGELTEQLGPR